MQTQTVDFHEKLAEIPGELLFGDRSPPLTDSSYVLVSRALTSGD
jgi:hypothetical protein